MNTFEDRLLTELKAVVTERAGQPGSSAGTRSAGSPACQRSDRGWPASGGGREVSWRPASRPAWRWAVRWRQLN